MKYFWSWFFQFFGFFFLVPEHSSKQRTETIFQPPKYAGNYCTEVNCKNEVTELFLQLQIWKQIMGGVLPLLLTVTTLTSKFQGKCTIYQHGKIFGMDSTAPMIKRGSSTSTKFIWAVEVTFRHCFILLLSSGISDYIYSIKPF